MSEKMTLKEKEQLMKFLSKNSDLLEVLEKISKDSKNSVLKQRIITDDQLFDLEAKLANVSKLYLEMFLSTLSQVFSKLEKEILNTNDVVNKSYQNIETSLSRTLEELEKIGSELIIRISDELSTIKDSIKRLQTRITLIENTIYVTQSQNDRLDQFLIHYGSQGSDRR